MAEVTLVAWNANAAEQVMSSRNDDIDQEFDDFIDELEEHRVALHQMIQDYVDEHALSDQIAALMVLNIGIRMHMVGYALETEKPSGSGLKIALDRFQREMDKCLRVAKKGADQFIAEAKAARAAAEAEDEDEAEGEPEG